MATAMVILVWSALSEFGALGRLGAPWREDEVRNARGRKSDEPRVVVQRLQRWHDQPAPRQPAANRRRGNGAPIPTTIHAVGPIQLLQLQLAPADYPIVRDQHARNRSEAARI